MTYQETLSSDLRFVHTLRSICGSSWERARGGNTDQPKDHVKYTHNDIVKPFRVGIIHYTENIHEMHDLYELNNYQPPPSMKGQEYNEADWSIREKYLSEDEISVATKARLPTSMQD